MARIKKIVEKPRLYRDGRPVNEFKRGVVHAWGHASSFVMGLAAAQTDDKMRLTLMSAASDIEDVANRYAEFWKDRI